jgi:two-component system phosphate regulon response regulator OmpR
LILDVMMPGETGFDLARFIRTSSSVPIIILTARHEAEARIEGLQIGADDYMPAKPFEPRRWCCGSAISSNAARRPAWRRWSRSRSDLTSITSTAASCARAGDRSSHRPRTRDAANSGAGARRNRAAQRATGDGTVNERAVDVQINRLRRKIERDPANPLFLQAARGIGYRLSASP